MAITLVEQGYKSIESWQYYRMRTEITYRGRGALIDIEKAKDNFNKDRKPRYFNYNIYGYMTKNCRKLKKEWDTRKCYKCDKIEHISKDCWSQYKMKNRSV